MGTGAVGRFLPLPLVAAPLRDVSSSVSPQSKLVKYFSRQLSCKKKVALQERNAELNGFPQLRHWFRIVDVRKEVLEVTKAARVLRPLPASPLGSGGILAVSTRSRPSVSLYWMETQRLSDAV